MGIQHVILISWSCTVEEQHQVHVCSFSSRATVSGTNTVKCTTFLGLCQGAPAEFKTLTRPEAKQCPRLHVPHISLPPYLAFPTSTTLLFHCTRTASPPDCHPFLHPASVAPTPGPASRASNCSRQLCDFWTCQPCRRSGINTAVATRICRSQLHRADRKAPLLVWTVLLIESADYSQP
jgi:hypothetical protein